VYVVLLSLLFIFGGSLLIHIISQDSGYILVSLGNYTFEVSFWFGLTLLVGVAIVVYLAFKWLITLRNILGESFSFIAESRVRAAEKRTQKGLLAFAEGNWLVAKKELLSAAKSTHKPSVHYLLSAQSAYRNGQHEEALFLLGEAEKLSAANELSIVLIRVRIFLFQNKTERALEALKHLSKDLSQHPSVLELLQQVYVKLKDWEALLLLLPPLKSCGSYTAEDFDRLQENVFLALLNEVPKITVVDPFDAGSKALVKKSTGTISKSLDGVWQIIPKANKKNIRIAGLYCKQLHAAGRDAEAEGLLRKLIKSQWQSVLVELYGKLVTADAAVQLSCAEEWLKDHPQDPHLLCALGRLSMRNSLWGKAKEYFERSLKLVQRAEVYAELAALMTQLGDPGKSAELNRRGLLLALE
jgi:HemY protein